MNNQQLEIVKGIAFVYDKLKLIVTQPVGMTIATRQNLDIKTEVAFLSGGPSITFPCDALSVAYQNLEAIQGYLGKPNREIPIVINVLDVNSEENVDDIYDEFIKEYNVLEKYINEDYKVRSLPCVYHNIEDYVIDSNKLEELNILTVNSKDFELEALINRSKQVFSSIIEEDIPNVLRKSRLVDNVFVANEHKLNMDTEEIVSYILENNSKVYIPFVYYNHDEELNGLIFANRYQSEIENDYDLEDINTGNADLTWGNSIGYLVESNDNNLNIKIANYVNYDLSGQTLVTALEDFGYFEEIMKDDIKEFMIDLEYKAKWLKLANEAIELIHEFEELIGHIGYSRLRDASINEDELTIVAIDPNDNVLELGLYEVASVYRHFIDGCGPCGGIFEEEIDFIIDDIDDDYKEKSKEEFIKYVGNVYYTKYRCQDIYDRLQEIEDEA